MAYRDTDWFVVYKASDPFDVTGETRHPIYLYQLGFDPIERCDGEVTVDSSVVICNYEMVTLQLIAEPGEEVWVWAGCAGWDDHPEFDYVLSFRGIAGGHTPSNQMTWGAIKAMFK